MCKKSCSSEKWLLHVLLVVLIFSFFCSSHLHQRNPWWIFQGRLHRFECYESSRWSVWTWTTRNEAAPPAAATRWATAALARIWSLRSTLEALVDGILMDFVHFLLRKLMKLVQITPSCRFFSVERYCRSYLEEGTQKRNYKEVIKQVGFRIGPCKTQLTSTSAGVCGLGWRWKYSTQQSNPEITDKSLPQFSEI